MAGTLYSVAILSKRITYLRNGVKLNLSTSATSVSQDYDKQEGVMKQKLNKLMLWYEQTTGMDEVRIAQNRVLEAEEKFISTQERRRESNKKVSDIQTKLKDLYAELDNTTRGEERYVQLITQEHQILKQERQIVDEFQRYEREEREHFSALSSAVKESHEKERAQSERTKYWSIIGSVIGTVLGIVGSSINNELKMKELRRLVKESLIINKGDGISTQVPEVLSRHEKELSVIVNEMKNVANLPGDHVIGRLNELIHTIDNKVSSENSDKVSNVKQVLEVLHEQELSHEKHFKDLKSILTTSMYELPEDQLIALPIGLEQRMRYQHQQTQYLLGASTVILVVFPLFMKYLGVF